MSDTIDSLKEAEKEAMGDKDHSLNKRRSHRGWQCGSNATGGLILIGLGIIFLLSQTTGFYLNNWWALFILIPAVHNLIEAWHSYQVNGRLGSHARHALFGGILLTAVAAFFLFNLSWNLFWPIVLIMVGISALIKAQSR